MTALAFFSYVVLLSGLIVTLIRKKIPVDKSSRVINFFLIWMVGLGLIAWSGFFTKTESFPPRIVGLFLCLLAYFIYLTRSSFVKEILQYFSQTILIGLQTFRFFVELFIAQISSEGLMPRVMTFHGRNFDMGVAIAAFIFLLIPSLRQSKKAILIFNYGGIIVLSNVVIHGILSAPGPQKMLLTEVPNVAVLIFPYVYLPGFFVALAYTLHILSIRKTSL